MITRMQGPHSNVVIYEHERSGAVMVVNTQTLSWNLMYMGEWTTGSEDDLNRMAAAETSSVERELAFYVTGDLLSVDMAFG